MCRDIAKSLGISAAKPPLGRTSTTRPVADDEKTPNGAFRRKLHRLLDFWRDHTANPRLKKCLRTRFASGASISRTTGRGATLEGVVKCRCKACPACLATRRAKYADQLNRMNDAVVGAGGGAYLVTFTVRHSISDRLATTALGIRDAWRAMLATRAWKSWRAANGFEYVVAEEMTFGGNGWHPHLHVLVFSPRRLDMSRLLEHADFCFEEWATVVEQHLGPRHVPMEGIGVDFRPCVVAEYISKCIGLELADPGTKEARSGGLSPIQLLEAASNGDMRALAAYSEYERVMKGRRDMTFSVGLRALRDIAKQQLKDEASEARDAAVEVVIPGLIWDPLCRRAGFSAEALEAMDRGGPEAVYAVVRNRSGPMDAERCRAYTKEVRERKNETKLFISRELQEISKISTNLRVVAPFSRIAS